MWRCKHVADALAHEHYRTMSRWRRWSLKLHVLLCVVCGRYHRHVMVMQDMADRFRDYETRGQLPANSPGLDAAARERLAAAVRAAKPDR